jgi:hypothetical protein
VVFLFSFLSKENKKEVNLASFVYPVAPEDGTGAPGLFKSRFIFIISYKAWKKKILLK